MKKDILAQKIRDDGLMQFAHSDSDKSISVLIELDLSEPKVEFKKSNEKGPGKIAPIIIVPETPDQQEENEKKIAEAKYFLQALLGTPAKWFKSAQVFAAEVSPSQVRKIASNPHIRAISPSKTYQRELHSK